LKITIFWDAAPCSLVKIDLRFRGAYCHHHQGALMMEAVSTSEMSDNSYEATQRNIPEDSHYHTRRCENLKSHQTILSIGWLWY
jgi:uncharacterized protein (DUF305 family)